MQKPNNGDVTQVAVGAEASRRIAWARFYEMQERTERLLRLNAVLEERLAELVILVSENEALQVLDADGELIAKARMSIAALRLRPRGQAALRRVMDRRDAAAEQGDNQ